MQDESRAAAKQRVSITYEDESQEANKFVAIPSSSSKTLKINTDLMLVSLKDEGT